MKAIAIILASTGALFLSSCACTKGGSCCSSGGASMSCCKDSAAKGKTCEKCAAGMKDTKKKM